MRRTRRVFVSGTNVSNFFTPVSDAEAEQILTPKFGLTMTSRAVRGCLRLAKDEGFLGCSFWRIAGGFDWRKHGSLFGTCHEPEWTNLQGWKLKDDTVTVNSLAFFVPRLLAGSTGRSVSQQRTLLAQTRARYDLTVPFLADFGSAVNVSGLLLSYQRLTGERAPLNLMWARSETFRDDVGGRLGFREMDGLRCGGWDGGDPRSDIGILPIGVVPLER